MFWLHGRKSRFSLRTVSERTQTPSTMSVLRPSSGMRRHVSISSVLRPPVSPSARLLLERALSNSFMVCATVGVRPVTCNTYCSRRPYATSVPLVLGNNTWAGAVNRLRLHAPPYGCSGLTSITQMSPTSVRHVK
jgi:hypothetical protein